jgi:hypothetical protein
VCITPAHQDTGVIWPQRTTLPRAPLWNPSRKLMPVGVAIEAISATAYPAFAVLLFMTVDDASISTAMGIAMMAALVPNLIAGLGWFFVRQVFVGPAIWLVRLVLLGFLIVFSLTRLDSYARDHVCSDEAFVESQASWADCVRDAKRDYWLLVAVGTTVCAGSALGLREANRGPAGGRART